MYFTRLYFGFPHFALYFGADDGGAPPVVPALFNYPLYRRLRRG
ncbi:MAG TPA: hypothetical protein VFH61_18815 [Thermoleophilia bacterium]|nr:hypothetical protein [Thermoleophilia bacterium]